MEQPSSAGQRKIDEYIDRIQNGESKESITEGLPASFVDAIEIGLNAKSDAIKNEKVRQDQLNEIREQLGINSDKLENQTEDSLEKKDTNELIRDLAAKFSKNKPQPVIDLYKRLLANIEDKESRKFLARALFQQIYNVYRRADYPKNSDEEKIWETYSQSTNIPINIKKQDWLYRGNFPEKGNNTVTRGSLNVEVTPELIDSLDQMILLGEIKANYKFGQPNMPTSPYERHDAISIYFLEEPSEKALQKIEEIIKPFVRGDNLLGRKVSEGFFMSEIGSIKSEHIDNFIELLKSKDLALAEAVKLETAPFPEQGTSLKMSEAQYYAIKDTLRAFGYEIFYDANKGFEVRQV